MALTVNSVEYRPFPETGSAATTVQPFEAGSMGMAFQMNFDVTSDVALTGKDIYINPAMWLPQNTPFDVISSVPLFGFKQNYPPIATPTGMGSLPTPRSGQGTNIQAVITATSAFDFVISVVSFYTFDLNDFCTDSAAPAPNRFTYNNVQSAVILDNSNASVYNDSRVYRALILVDDLLGGGIDFVFSDADFSTRWYEKTLLNVSPGEYFDWTYRLERNGIAVTNFSPTDATTVFFTVDTATVGKIRPTQDFVIYREDSPIEGFGFFQDLEGAFYQGVTNIAGLTAITAETDWALVAGTIYECSYTIDPNYLTLNGQYRLIIGAADDTGASYAFHNSFITPLIIVVDAPPPPTTGTMTGEIKDYNDIYTGSCLQVTLQERVKMCVTVDKATYDAELLVNGADGDFDTNLNSVQVKITDFIAQTTIVNVNTTSGDPELRVSDTNAFYEVCFTWRVPESLANRFLLVEFIFNYDLIATATQVAYKDIITYPMSLNTALLEEDKVTPLITDIEFLIFGQPITELCDDDFRLIQVKVDVDASLNGYNLIALIRPDIQSAIIEEQEDYDNNVLAQLDTIFINSVDVNFAAGTASFFLDPGQLVRGQKYRVYAVAKETALPQPDCPVIVLDAITDVTISGPVGLDEQTTIQCDFIITNFSPSVVTNVDINTTVSGLNVTGPNQNDNFVTDTGNYNYTMTFAGGFRGIPATVQQIFDITLSNGCTYTGRVVLHAIIPLVGSITQSVTNEDAD